MLLEKGATPGTAVVLVAAGDEDEARVRRGRSLLLDEASHQQLAETFRALADTTRSKIVYSLLWQDLSTTELAAIVGTSESAVSQHLRVLRQLRIVKGQRKGKMVIYSLDDEHIRTLVSVCLGHIRDAGRQPLEIGRVLGLMADAARLDEAVELNSYGI